MASAGLVEASVDALRTQIMKMQDLNKIENFLNDPIYKELIESSETFNTRLCLERKMRMPFLDPQTGIAQKNSNLYMKKSQRIPGLKEGQIYTYPSQRWRKSRRQYLLTTTNYHQPYSYRPFGRFRDSEFDSSPIQVLNAAPTGPPASEVMVDNSSSMGITDQDSKDSSHNNDVPKEWFYDEIDMNEMEGFENEHEQDSDFDYEEPYSSRRKKRGRASTGRGRGAALSSNLAETPARRGRGRGVGRSKKVAQIGPPPMDTSSNSSDKFVDFTRSRRGVQMPPQQPIPTGPQPPSHVMSSAHINLSQPINFEDPIPMHTLMCKGQMDNKHLDEELSSSSTSQTNSSLPKSHPYAQHHKDKPKAAPSLYCDFCLGDARLNKKSNAPEELVSCSDCGRSGHPTCLQFTKNMIISVRKYRWQCIECKYCSICGTSDNDDQLLFCDDCDRGLHIYCLSPPLTHPPEGSWSCKLCTEEFHANK